MRILLTNDDGYRAIGINSLFKLLLSYGHDVIIIAPEMNSSGYSQSISVYTPVKIHQVSERVYFVSSTPADSVRLGLQIVYGDTNNYPDLIISGINSQSFFYRALLNQNLDIAKFKSKNGIYQTIRSSNNRVILLPKLQSINYLEA